MIRRAANNDAAAGGRGVNHRTGWLDRLDRIRTMEGQLLLVCHVARLSHWGKMTTAEIGHAVRRYSLGVAVFLQILNQVIDQACV